MKIIVKTNVNLERINIGRVNQIGLLNSTQTLVKRAADNAPYATGTLSKSITADPGAITTTTKKVRVGPRGVVYGKRREYENKKNPHKKYYMRRTYLTAQDVVQKSFEEAVKIVTSKL